MTSVESASFSQFQEYLATSANETTDLNSAVAGHVVFTQDVRYPVVTVVDSPGTDRSQKYLEISAQFTLSPDRRDAILRDTLDVGKQVQLPRRQHTATAKQFWEIENFGKETLTPSHQTGIRVHSVAETIDPTSIRMSNDHIRVHTASVVSDGRTLIIEADGAYRQYLHALAIALKPDKAVVNITHRDAERLAVKAARSGLSERQRDHVRQKLKTAQQTINGRELIINTDIIPVVSQHLNGINLYRPDKTTDTQIVRLLKSYSFLDGVKDTLLSDLQQSATLLEAAAFSAHGSYAVSEQGAKALLDRELEALTEMYVNSTIYRHDHFDQLGNEREHIVEKLAREVFDDRIVDPYRFSESQFYVLFLRSFGYTPQLFSEGDVSSDKIVNQRHLLEFYKQVHARRPAETTSRYRESYMQKKPKTVIISKLEKDASQLPRLSISPHALVYSLGIHKRPEAAVDDNITRLEQFSGDETVLFIRNNVSGSPLQPMNDHLCDRVGVSFSVPR